MRKMFSKLVAAVALMAASSAPAMACGGYFGGGCSPCGQAYASPCGGSYGGYGYGGVSAREILPEPSRYYYASQGPSFSGPGNYAPYPTYQETALGGYARPNYGQYDGGPYANPVNHYSYAQPAYRSPAVYRYRPHVRPSYRYGYRMQPRHYGYASRSYGSRYGYHQHRRFAGPRMSYAPRYAGPRHAYPQRRMY